MRSKFCVLVLALCVGVAIYPWVAGATTLDISDQNSRITFKGEHAGMAFSGTFEEWQSRLILPPSKSPSIEAVFELASAKTGDWTYDSTLPEEDWFNIEKHPKGKFQATDITSNAAGFHVKGELTLKGIGQPVEFQLIGDAERGFKATIVVDRLAHKIGYESDPNAEWVSQEIILDLIINHP